MVKIIVIGITVCLMGIFFGGEQRGIVIGVEIAFACLALTLLLGDTLEAIDRLRSMFNTDGTVREVFACLLKAALICIGTRFAADLCKEKGGSFVADIIDFSGRITLLILCLPFVEGIISAAMRFVK